MSTEILQRNSINGFTLIETLVAISILLLVIVGPMTIAQRGIQTSYHSSEQLTAIFLAQEALEGVRQLRDTTALASYDEWAEKTAQQAGGGQPQAATDKSWAWFDEIPSQCIFDGEGGTFDPNDTNLEGCAFNIDANEFVRCGSNGAACKLEVKDGEYGFNIPNGIVSPFTRKIYFVEYTDPVSAMVVVEVTWSSQITESGEKRITLQSWVYDQYHHYEFVP